MTRSNPRHEPCECYLWYTSLTVLQKVHKTAVWCVHAAGYGKKKRMKKGKLFTARKNGTSQRQMRQYERQQEGV